MSPRFLHKDANNSSSPVRSLLADMHSLKRSRLTLHPPFVHAQSECLTSRTGATIGKLSDKMLLKIFCYYLDAPQPFWPRLAHICCRWRRIVFGCFRLYFTHRAPVPTTLDCRPAPPIVVQFGGSLALEAPAREGDDNIIAALKKSDRVSSISLTVTSSLLGQLSAIKKPFSELEDLVLLSQDSVQLILPSTFRWGPRLRCLHSTRIAFPALLQPLYSYRNLVDLQLHEVLYPWHLTPEALTNALSGMAQLQSLSIHFLYTADYRASPPPSGKRVILPVLTRLNFRGLSQYLESLLARIDAPRVGDIEVNFSNENISHLPELTIFIDRIEMHKSHRQAHIRFSERASSISLIQPGAPTCLKLQLFCDPSSERLLSMARICVLFSAFLFNVEDLRISATQPSSWADPHDHERGWLELINSFTGVKWFHVAGNLSTHIVRAWQSLDRKHKIVLPALHKLYMPQPGPRPAPLNEAVLSLMTSRRLSGNPIGVEYERLSHISELRGTEPFSHRATIEMLSDDTLLNIFLHVLEASSQFWPTLVHVSHRWRQIIFMSPLGLDLRLHCTHGTPVLKTLDCWPALPIIVRYGGVPSIYPPAPEDDDNIIAALKQSGRVSSISLTVSSSLLEKLSAISEPFSELQELALLSRNDTQLTLPSTFRWGPRLRTLHSTRIVFPLFPQLLSPCRDLVDIRLHEISSAGYFSPEALANALSGTTQLQTLSLHFLTFPPRRNYLGLPLQPGERTVLPALTCLRYRGTSKYLDSFVARIDAPRLGDINITFFSQPTMDASQLGRFIERIKMQTSFFRADVETSAHAIYISFINSNTYSPLQLRISCKQFDWQLSSMAQFCDQLSPFLFHVKHLVINTTQSPSGQDDVNGEQWLELIRAFGGAKGFRVTGVHVTDILCALRTVDGSHTTETTVLPALRNLRVDRPVMMHGPSWDAVQSFITSRWLSGRPVEVYARKYSCHICSANLAEQQELRTHLVDNHAYRIMCSYCGDFECMPGHNHLFLEHLASKHPEVTHTDSTPISNPTFSPGSDGTGHNDHLRTSDIFGLFTKLRAPDAIARLGNGDGRRHPDQD